MIARPARGCERSANGTQGLRLPPTRPQGQLMAKTLRDAIFAIANPSAQWSARDSLAAGFWPPLRTAPNISMRELVTRFAGAGAALRALASGGSDVWQHVTRSGVTRNIRD